MILISNDFWHTLKMYNFDPFNVFLSISTNIPVLIMPGFVYISLENVFGFRTFVFRAVTDYMIFKNTL